MATAHRGIALLIGNSEYDCLRPLKSVVNDVREMSRKFNECDYEVILATNLNIDQINVKISNLKDRLEKDQHREVLIYYAGHGLIYRDEHYLVARQFNDKTEIMHNEIDRNCLSVDRGIIGSVCNIAVGHRGTRSIVIILDACRSTTDPVTRDLNRYNNQILGSVVLRHELEIGVLVGYACAPRAIAYETGSGKNGIYTDCILQNIFVPGKNILDGISSANRQVAHRKNFEQTPYIYVNDTELFRYSLIQARDAQDNKSPTLQLLQREIENLRANIQSQEERDRINELLQAEHEELKLEKEQRDRDNKLLQTERDRLKLEKEKLEQEFQRVQKEFEKFRFENSKREEQISNVDIMEKLYKSTQGALWTKNRDRLSWQLNSCTSEFKEADGRITYINLYFNNLIGMIPQELGRLSYLTYLNLSCNKLKGAIPKELGELLKLEKLWLNRNQLTGAIPVELGKLLNLEQLVLCGNQLTGAIPKELGELKSLTSLYLHDNQLTGKIPVELGNLSKLEKLYLGKHTLWIFLTGNQLTGEIPKKLGELSELKELDLSNNKLTGAVPKELGELSELKELNLSGNQLTGAVPKELGELSKLQRLYLSNNQLTGSPPRIPNGHVEFQLQRSS